MMIPISTPKDCRSVVGKSGGEFGSRFSKLVLLEFAYGRGLGLSNTLRCGFLPNWKAYSSLCRRDSSPLHYKWSNSAPVPP